MTTPSAPRDAGFDPAGLERLAGAIDADIAAERYDGCELVVARGGAVAFHRRFGFAERAAGTPVAPAQPFVTMSIGKQLAVVATLQRVERGDFSLATPVAEARRQPGGGGAGHRGVAAGVPRGVARVVLHPGRPRRAGRVRAARRRRPPALSHHPGRGPAAAPRHARHDARLPAGDGPARGAGGDARPASRAVRPGVPGNHGGHPGRLADLVHAAVV